MADSNVLSVQKILFSEGYLPKVPDGVLCGDTQNAFRMYCKANGINPNLPLHVPASVNMKNIEKMCKKRLEVIDPELAEGLENEKGEKGSEEKKRIEKSSEKKVQETKLKENPAIRLRNKKKSK